MDLIDVLMEQLDEHWSEPVQTPEFLPELFHQVPQNHDDRDEIICELCAADMEWRWKTASKHSFQMHPFDHAKALTSEVSGSLLAQTELPKRLSAKPTAAEYFAFPEVSGCAANWLQELVMAEWQTVRNHHVDPDIRTYRRLWREDADWNSRLSLLLGKLAPLFATVTRSGQVCMRQILPVRFCIGRQKLGEPAVPCWNSLERRLALADGKQKSLSRSQFQVERISLKRVTLRNGSSAVSVPFGDTKLCPGEVVELTLPVTIDIADMVLRLEL